MQQFCWFLQKWHLVFETLLKTVFPYKLTYLSQKKSFVTFKLTYIFGVETFFAYNLLKYAENNIYLPEKQSISRNGSIGFIGIFLLFLFWRFSRNFWARSRNIRRQRTRVLDWKPILTTWWRYSRLIWCLRDKWWRLRLFGNWVGIHGLH